LAPISQLARKRTRLSGAHIFMRQLRTTLPLLLPLLAAGVVYTHLVLSPRGLPDDEAYLCAIRAVAQGNSPYRCPRYLYPPLLAQLGAALTAFSSDHAVMVLLRALNLLAAVWIAHFSLVPLALSAWRRAGASALLLVWSPSLREALYVGNLSPLVSMLVLWALARWPTRPLSAGAVLGFSIALKPVGALVLLLLALHRPDRAQPQAAGAAAARRFLTPQLKAAAAGILTAALALLAGASQLAELAQQGFRHLEALHNVSLLRAAWLLGFALAPTWLFGAVGVAAIVYLRRTPLTAARLSHLCCAAALLALPVVWCHTLILAYPLLVAALARALREAPATPAGSAPVLRLLGVCVAMLCVAQSDLFGDLGELTSHAVAALLALLPLCLCAVLAHYAVRSRD
jgi:hypothetical protein